jgi:hypothetical protein
MDEPPSVGTQKVGARTSLLLLIILTLIFASGGAYWYFNAKEELSVEKVFLPDEYTEESPSHFSLKLRQYNTGIQHPSEDRSISRSVLLKIPVSDSKWENVPLDEMLSWPSRHMLHRDKLYYFAGTSVRSPHLAALDLFTGAKEEVPLKQEMSKPIHDFFAWEGKIYYLTGAFCNEYKATCKDMVLKVYDLFSGETKELTNISTSRNILGFANNDQMILSYQDGDAGCSWWQYETFTFSTKSLQEGDSSVWCNEDPLPRLDPARFVSGIGHFDGVILRGVEIRVPQREYVYGGDWEVIPIRISTQEYQHAEE